MKSITQIISFAVLCGLLISCNKDERQAKNSIEGMWEVTAITTTKGQINNAFFVETSTETETGQLGTFDFLDETVNYNFTRIDTTYNGSSIWFLKSEKINAGFTRVNQHTLTLTDNFIFDVTFEDDTKNAEKNAKKMTLTKNPIPNNSILIMISLEKIE
jgi:hypothetical protein